ncbi:MAG: 2-oxoacid:acceptor oxidoreductase family protein [Deltaproteobacteria bacterium]|nr:2-oxoacid:acceptor oxidoreductase family protein [Deltaproteobacteria bacterium]
MLRIRFHGRGGQGMKTASRILGSAGFHAGFVVQDSPVYGAERRGAPMSAFTRLAREPIRERGTVATPDLIVIADDTLLADQAAQPLLGCDEQTTILLNSTKEVADLQQIGHALAKQVLTADFTTLAIDTTQSLASLSVALGVATARLVGLSLADALVGIGDELSSHLSDTQRSQNTTLAQAAYARAKTWPVVQERLSTTTIERAVLADVAFDPPSLATPSIYASGNSPERKTGNWRQFRPILHADLCTRCWICFVRCPEAAISLDAQDYPVVDYDECKGCLLCVHECPTHAFTTEKEVR